jgi:hypothetical protein
MENQTQRKMVVASPKDGMNYIYSNHLRIGYTITDIKVLFGEVTDVTDETYTVTERTQVTMTWLQAKILTEMLSNHVATYEKYNGPIKTSYVSPFIVPLPTIPTVTSPTE